MIESYCDKCGHETIHINGDCYTCTKRQLKSAEKIPEYTNCILLTSGNLNDDKPPKV